VFSVFALRELLYPAEDTTDFSRVGFQFLPFTLLLGSKLKLHATKVGGVFSKSIRCYSRLKLIGTTRLKPVVSSASQ
jgi:hypothetical protein